MLKWLVRLFIVMMLGAVLGVASLIGIYFYIKPQLPDVTALRDVKLATPMRVYSRDGELIAQYGEIRRIPLRLDEIPKPMIDAVLATEDARFYEHPGIDPIGILRAATVWAVSGQARQGASTITQQVARNFFLSNEKTLIRKIKEVFLAWRIEQNLSKDEILELYLNKIPLGYRAFGVGAAAQVYFGKEVKDLGLDEIAIIAGLPKAPSMLNPIRSPERAFARRNVVLGRMLETGKITQAQFDEASKMPIKARYHGAEVTLHAPYLGEMVRQKMVEQFGEDAYTMGLHVYTTVSAERQRAARQALLDGVFAYDMRHGYRGPSEQLWKAGEPSWDYEQIVAHLAKQPTYDPLMAAVVTKLDDRNATLVLKNGKEATLGWNGIKWARAFITDDRQGYAPKSARDVLKVGARIWVREQGEELLLAQIPDVNAALVAMNPKNGALEALVGGFSFELSKFNRVDQARRQIGSNIKPFLYATALEHGYTLASLINDAPINQWDPSKGPMWQPKNSPAVYDGPTPLRLGLAKSKNVMSVRLMRAIGLDTYIDGLTRFGFPRDFISPHEALALGAAEFTPLEVVRGYSVLANGGFLVTPYFIDKVTDSQENTLYQANPAIACTTCEQQSDPQQQTVQTAPATEGAAPSATAAIAPHTISAQSSFLITDTLSTAIWGGNGWRGTGWRAARDLKRHDISGKTGTTNESRDAWFSGYTPDIVATSWIGFDNHQRGLGRAEFGGGAAQPIWIDFMKVALKNIPEHKMPVPEGIMTVKIDSETGLLATGGGTDEYFKEGTEPTRYATPTSDGNQVYGGDNPNVEGPVSTDDIF
ncbi:MULTISPECIES: penicillin-binding protein 1A [Aeromonas]|uniref:penicillin-binding protein 1A n=1 Tax=Aeromonas TaxID=642 RepID=UPI000CE18CBD|nr:PBP1A family penicillin-binding protein [Aeromonas jandaei]MBL0609352.1 PBP1A family penicillin-binding protein [Aeromonas jandaei]PPA30752.1 penicillin-sensitive transpeptidase [Aeromonas jandaei]TNH95736.1 penicillin-sensitive transpeptidase [Aeromonas jandaei]